jgi:hypothetical protein
MEPFQIILNAFVLALTSTEISRNKTKYLSAVISIYCLKYLNIQNVYLYLYNLFTAQLSSSQPTSKTIIMICEGIKRHFSMI